MNQIKTEVFVNLPPAQVRRLLDLFLRDHPEMTLRAACAPRSSTMAATERTVTVFLERAAGGSRGFERLGVSWGPCEGGPYLTFKGEVEVTADAGHGACRIALCGSYIPPLGIAGQAFEFIVGRRVAIAIAGDLLNKIRTAIEPSYRESAREISLWSARAV